MSKDVANLTGGTVLYTEYAFGAKKSPPNVPRNEKEFILKKETKYAIVYTADSDTNGAQILLNWHEEES